MRKKKTHAYKVGYGDGQFMDYNNPYAEGSTRHDDYTRGFNDAVNKQKGRAA